MYDSKITKSQSIKILTPGGELKVKFNKNSKGYKDIFLIGPAVQVFKGEIIC